MNPLFMEEILPSIFVFLDIKDLKSARLVGKLWSVAGCKELVTKSSSLQVPSGFYHNLPSAKVSQSIPECFRSSKITAVTIRIPKDIDTFGLNETGRQTEDLKALKFLSSNSSALTALLRRCPNLTLLDMPPTPTAALVKICEGPPCPSPYVSVPRDNATATLINSLLDVYDNSGSGPGKLQIRSLSLVLGQLLALEPSKLSRIAELPVKFLQIHLDLSFHLIVGGQLPHEPARFSNRLLLNKMESITELNLVLNANSPSTLISFPIMQRLRKFALCLTICSESIFNFPPGFQFDSHFPSLHHFVLSFSSGHFHMYTIGENLRNLEFLRNVGVSRSVRTIEFDQWPCHKLDQVFMHCPYTEKVIIRNFYGTAKQLTSLLESPVSKGLKELQVHVTGTGPLDPATLYGAGPFLYQPEQVDVWEKRVGDCLGKIESALTGFSEDGLLKLKTADQNRKPATIQRLRVAASILDCPVLEELMIYLSGPIQTGFNSKFLYTLTNTLPLTPPGFKFVILKVDEIADLSEILRCSKLTDNPKVSIVNE